MWFRYSLSEVKLNRNIDTKKFVYNGSEIAFDGTSVHSLVNGKYSQNVVVFV